MEKIPYIEYDKEDMILRDFLALHRSQLANERTLLAYARTALAISAAGFTLAKLAPERGLIILGWTLVPVGIMIAIIGLYRFLFVNTNFKDLDRVSPKGGGLDDTEDELEMVIEKTSSGN